MADVKDVYKVSKWEEKQRYIDEHRDMWRTCFHDPICYEDFYFQHVYPYNEVYGIEEKGMLHVNRYLCSVFGYEIKLPYIVGVATKESCRRQGVMRCTMEQMLANLQSEKVPFAYLMPAKEAYYYDFGFCPISSWQTCDIFPDKETKRNDCVFVSYEQMKKLPERFQNVLERIRKVLQDTACIFAVHDVTYFDLLYEEKKCQNGDIIFVFDNTDAIPIYCGYFAYVMDGDTPVVEQIMCDDANTICATFFEENPLIKCVFSYPYMMKVVHRDAFIALFKEVLDACKDVRIDDMSDKELIEIVRQRKNCFYFAEIV